jgi:NADPH:quinone reductase-like Zn-dependent oxidoreductase
MTTTARVAQFDSVGGPEVLKVVQVPLEEPAAGDVQVRIDAIGMNRVEVLFRAGHWPEQPTFPGSRLGIEAAGVVEKVGAGIVHVKPGDTVSIVGGQNMSRYGVYADYVNLPGLMVMPRPPELEAVPAAALWVAYLTAYATLVEVGQAKAGDYVLITAATSSVGLAAIQIANHIGAIPIAVSRTSHKSEQLLKAGAAHVLSNDDGNVVERAREISGRGVQIILDAVGGPGTADIAQAAETAGLLVVYGFLDPRPILFPRNWPLRMYGFNVEHVAADPEIMARAAQFIGSGAMSGALVPTVDRTFELADIAEAHRYVESNQQVGKVVVTVQH